MDASAVYGSESEDDDGDDQESEDESHVLTGMQPNKRQKTGLAKEASKKASPLMTIGAMSAEKRALALL